MTPVAIVVNALETHGCRPRERAGGFVAHCPAHDDGRASLVVTEGADERALLRCWAGCATESVVDALDLVWSDLFADGPRNPMEAWIA
jgi:hypothetical protein